MRVDVYDKNFNKIDLDSLNVVTTNFILDSPSPNHERQETSGQHGTVTLGTTLGARAMSVTFHIRAEDAYDFPLIRNELFNKLNGLEFVYLVDKREPGKRWKVKVESNYDTAPTAMVFAAFDISFTSDSPFSESIGSTTDPFTFDSNLWQIGQGLVGDNLTYSTTEKNFQIYNAGNVTIDPRFIHTPLTIEVTCAQTSTSITLSLTNNTTGETWSYTGATTAGQVIQLKNVETLSGGASVALKTNYGLLTLKPGYNDISRNSGISKVSFIHRFYYV
ncbi:phage tail family protein [Priestia megaterium]|uniref:phage tail family protein n=1 Tax=Priestia megaterium TaxID=1404 RepID=UPI002E1E1247|nr:phage tail family protein [Priestia megaterium]